MRSCSTSAHVTSGHQADFVVGKCNNASTCSSVGTSSGRQRRLSYIRSGVVLNTDGTTSGLLSPSLSSASLRQTKTSLYLTLPRLRRHRITQLQSVDGAAWIASTSILIYAGSSSWIGRSALRTICSTYSCPYNDNRRKTAL